MKTVHLIRHAKSSWDHPGLSDVDRPLNDRGIRACKIMAQPIWDAGCRFENVFCSRARRTQLTIQGLADALPGKPIDWQVEDALYTFSGHALLDWVMLLDESLDDIVMVGHNPATTDFCNGMAKARIPNVPTCGYAQIHFPQSRWMDLKVGSGKLACFLTPKTVEKA
ncbi:MAG: histidine phosphatase family protein [Puniceicoccaceae bacterium]